jgi:hypothetical protein
MISSTECRKNATDCFNLAAGPDVTVQRRTALLAMTRSWTTLANQIERLHAIMKEEGPSSP